MKFENLFNIMHCDFFEVHKNGEIECIEYEMSGKMLAACKKYFDDTVMSIKLDEDFFRMSCVC